MKVEDAVRRGGEVANEGEEGLEDGGAGLGVERGIRSEYRDSIGDTLSLQDAKEGVAPCCYFLGGGKHEEGVVGSLGGVEGSVQIAVGDVDELKRGLEAIGAACRISKMKK